ncbi:MAG: GNAT family N-acetyltransferase [Dehalococcoidia bacterium]|nr:GNAT family N-acetyltransferase [Dehalococcoidia bacterium]
MSVRVTQETFDSLTAPWEQLLPGAAANTIFLTPLWQRTWWETLGTNDGAGGEAPRELLLLAVRDGQGLIGVAPMQRSGGAIAFLGDTDVFDYHDFIVRRGREDEFFTALCAYLKGQPWDRLYLPSVPEGSPTIEHLARLTQQHGWRCVVEREDVSPGMPLPASWEEYLATLSKKDRHELRRKLRRLSSAAQPTFLTHEDAELDRHLDQFLRLMREGREDKQSFLTPAREGFFRAVCHAVAKSGSLRLHFLELGGTPVAAALCFDYDGRRLLYNSGFAPEHQAFSVGLMVKALSIQEAISKRLEYFDFLRGDEPYKYDLGAKDRVVYRIEVFRA